MVFRNRLSGVNRLGLVTLACLFGIAYYPTARKLVSYRAANDVYSYAFFVPPISAWLVWLKRRDLEAASPKPSLVLGTIASLAGLGLFLVGRFSSTNLVEEVSLVVTMCGLTLLVLGPQILKHVLFPIVYLSAVVPFWEYLTNPLHPYFQLYSAAIGVNALKLWGIPALREGFLIALPNITLEVAEACSGINYLIAVLCIGIPVTHMFVRSVPKQLFITVAAAFIALLSNGARVAIVCLFAYYGIRGTDGDIHGPLALFRSLLISGVGFVALFGLVSFFADAPAHPPADTSREGEGHGIRRIANWLPELRPAAILLAVGMLAACVSFDMSHRVVAVPLKRDLHSFPRRIGSWQARLLPAVASDLETLDFDDTLSRSYIAADGAELNLFVGYLKSQQQGRELAGYGIRTRLSSFDRLQDFAASDRRQAEAFAATTEPRTLHATYWYSLGGRVVSRDYAVKAYTAWDSIVHGTTNGAIVVVKAVARDRDSADAIHRRVQEFASAVNAVLPAYLD